MRKSVQIGLVKSSILPKDRLNLSSLIWEKISGSLFNRVFIAFFKSLVARDRRVVYFSFYQIHFSRSIITSFFYVCVKEKIIHPFEIKVNVDMGHINLAYGIPCSILLSVRGSPFFEVK